MDQTARICLTLDHRQLLTNWLKKDLRPAKACYCLAKVSPRMQGLDSPDDCQPSKAGA